MARAVRDGRPHERPAGGHDHHGAVRLRRPLLQEPERERPPRPGQARGGRVLGVRVGAVGHQAVRHREPAGAQGQGALLAGWGWHHPRAGQGRAPALEDGRAAGPGRRVARCRGSRAVREGRARAAERQDGPRRPAQLPHAPGARRVHRVRRHARCGRAARSSPRQGQVGADGGRDAPRGGVEAARRPHPLGGTTPASPPGTLPAHARVRALRRRVQRRAPRQEAGRDPRVRPRAAQGTDERGGVWAHARAELPGVVRRRRGARDQDQGPHRRPADDRRLHRGGGRADSGARRLPHACGGGRRRERPARRADRGCQAAAAGREGRAGEVAQPRGNLGQRRA